MIKVHLFCLALTTFFSCDTLTPKKYNTPAEYDFNHPEVINLPDELREISGIEFYPKDTSVFAISDASGSIYKISVHKKVQVQKWKFEKNRDFEDVQLLDSTFYVLSSSGRLYGVKFTWPDKMDVEKYKFPEEKSNQFESLFYNKFTGNLVLLCKNCKDEKKNTASTFDFNLATHSFQPGSISIKTKQMEEKLKTKKFELKASAAAINPVTNDLYILSSINKMLVTTDLTGKVKSYYHLNPSLYKQPEGLAFTPSGNIIISNEYNKDGEATLLIIKRKAAHS